MKTTIKTKQSELTCDSLGGELISYKLDGKEYVWEGLAEYWGGHAPVLFPVICETLNNQVKIGGVSYPLTKHGFARKSEFKLVEEGNGKAVYELCDSEATRKLYPFAFKLIITHALTADGFKTEFKVINTDNKPMVFCIGGHPAFKCPMNDGEKFSDYKIIFDKVETNAEVIQAVKHNGVLLLDRDNPTVPRLQNTDEWTLAHEDFDRDAFMIVGHESRRVKLVHKDTGKGIEFSFDGFGALGIWSPTGKCAPFVCIEPWNGLPAYIDESGNFEDKPFAVTLGAGETYAVGYSVKVIK